MRRASGAVSLVLIGSAFLLHACDDNVSTSGGSWSSGDASAPQENAAVVDATQPETGPASGQATQSGGAGSDWSTGHSHYTYHSSGSSSGGWSFPHSYSGGGWSSSGSTSHSEGFHSSTSRGGFGHSASAHAGGGE